MVSTRDKLPSDLLNVNDAHLENMFGEGAPEKVRYLAFIEEVRDPKSLPPTGFMRSHTVEDARGLAKFYADLDGIKGPDGGDPEDPTSRENAESESETTADKFQAVERANAGVDPVSGADMVERVKNDPVNAVHASDDQLFQAVRELWNSNRMQARNLLNQNRDRISDDRQNAITGEADTEATTEAAQNRYMERNPPEPSEAAKRRANADPDSDAGFGTMEMAPGANFESEAEKRQRQNAEDSRQNADGVDLSLSPEAAKDRHTERENARLDAASEDEE